MEQSIIYVYILLIFVFINSLSFYRWVTHRKFSHLSKKKVYINEINSGDVLIVAYQKPNFLIQQSLFRVKYTHAAICVWKDKQLYVVDLLQHSYKLVPFSEWTRRYKNQINLLNKLEIEDDVNGEKRKKIEDGIIKIHDQYKDIKPKFNFSWLRFVFPAKEYDKTSKDRHSISCVELVAFMLIELDVVKKNKSLESFSPDEYEFMKGFDTNPGYMFKENFVCDFTGFKHLWD